MQKSDYLAIKNQLSFSKPLWVTLAVIVADWALLYVAFFVMSIGGAVAFIASQVLIGILCFHNFVLLHEAGHGNVSNSPWVNEVVGHYASIFCFLPFFPWKTIHQGHHVWVGNVDKDPTLEVLGKLRQVGKIPKLFHYTWKGWVPLSGFMQHVSLWRYPFELRKKGGASRKALQQSFFSVAFMVVAYAVLLIAFPQWITFKKIGLGVLFYFVFTEMQNLPHHASMPTFRTSEARDKLHPWEQHIATRSCDFPWIFSELLTLNFALHTEHHFFPNLPWFRLKKLQAMIKDPLSPDYSEEGALKWGIKNRIKGVEEVWLTPLSHSFFE